MTPGGLRDTGGAARSVFLLTARQSPGFACIPAEKLVARWSPVGEGIDHSALSSQTSDLLFLTIPLFCFPDLQFLILLLRLVYQLPLIFLIYPACPGLLHT